MQYNPLIDIGVNLTHRRFADDRGAVIERALAAGVHRMIATGVTLAESRAALSLAAEYPDVLSATAGVHPHHASEWTGDSEAELAELLAMPRAVAAGETGLDYNRDFSPRDAQRRAFEAQLGLAAARNRPAFLHHRDAESDFLAILKEQRDGLGAAVLHCFTGDRAFLYRCLDLDLHIGVTGWVCDARRGADLRACVASIPEDRLMIETDAPFLLPADLPEKPPKRRNEPAFLPHVLKTVADLRGDDPHSLAMRTSANARRFFAL